MNLTVTFESAEHQLTQILEEFFVSVYDKKSLVSHGIEHHRRVWKFAKELVFLLNEQNLISDFAIVSRLIITCYLHDIGMSVDAGIKHGHHSSDLCIRFLKDNSLDIKNYQDVLFAIENHDNKAYKTSATNNDLLKILSVADDLDAFGFTGIYRYSEIYLTRGINPKDLGTKVKENASGRFNNFVKIFGFAEEYVEKHKKRYEILDNFFSEYNNQALTYKFAGTNPTGYCGVIEVLNDVLSQKGDSKDTGPILEKYSNAPVIHWYFSNLTSESENF